MNEVPYFSTAHPETLSSEVYLGNFTQEDAMSIGWKTKRHGVKSYCVDGSDYPSQTEHGILPYFADKRELFEAGMRQVMMQSEDYRMRGMAQLSNALPQAHADEQEKPAPPTRWQRFRRWLREVTR